MIVQAFVLYLICLVLFAVIDTVFIAKFIAPDFRRKLGSTMRDELDGVAGIAFYVLFTVGVVYLAAWPGFVAQNTALAATKGLAVGLTAYVAYEVTNKATILGWTWSMVAKDVLWGSFLTGFTAGAGTFLALAIM